MISLSKVIFSLLLIFSFSGCAHKEIDIDDYLNLKMRSKNIDEMIDKKTNGALKEHKRAISDIIDYLDYAIKKGVEIGEEKFNLLKKKVFDIEASTEDTLKSITESKISFNPGKSNLSARDKTKIDQNVKRILNLEKKILKKESKEQFVILVKRLY